VSRPPYGEVSVKALREVAVVFPDMPEIGLPALLRRGLRERSVDHCQDGAGFWVLRNKGSWRSDSARFTLRFKQLLARTRWR
jgi:hypothetical protein